MTTDHEERITKLEAKVLTLRILVVGLYIAQTDSLAKLPADKRQRGRELIADLERAAKAGDDAIAASKIAELFDLVVDDAPPGDF